MRMERSQKQFAERLTLLRKTQGMTQQTVAEILNVSRPAYAYYELGKSSPSLESMRRLVRLFCPDAPQYLLVLDEPALGKVSVASRRGNEKLSVMAELTAEEQQIVGMFRVMDQDSKRKALQALKTVLNG